jgi:hypothetical protein
MDRIKNDASNNSSIVSFVFFAAGKFLMSRCLATDTLRNNGSEDKHKAYRPKRTQANNKGTDGGGIFSEALPEIIYRRQP